MALRLRSEADSILALTVGPPEADIVLRDAIAVGADAVLRLWDESRTYSKPPMSSILLAAALRAEDLPDLVLCGARSVDRCSGKLPALLGEHLDWPVVTDITHFDLEQGKVKFQRRLARGARAEGEVMLPAVLGLEAGLAQLRHASLPGVMRAKQTSIPVRYLADLGLSSQDLSFPAATLHAVMPPHPRPRTIFIPDSSLSAHERIDQILSAGVTSKTGQVIEKGSPEEMADAIIAFLDERGFLEESS
jgi:electron transfer flavoprotein beta subunit